MTLPMRHASLPSRLQPRANHPNQPIAQLSITFQLRRMGDDHQSVVEVDDGSSFEILVGNFCIDRLAVLEFGHLARFIEPTVDVLVTVMPVVLGRPALEENVAVAVRIYAPAPTDEEGLEASLLGFGE